MIDVTVASLDPAEKASTENLACYKAHSPSASLGSNAGPKQEAYPVRWLRDHYTLSPAAAKVIAAEFGWLEAA
jgi:hypothetical protein